MNEPAYAAGFVIPREERPDNHAAAPAVHIQRSLNSMQYVTEDLSPVKKKIVVTVPAEEGDAALAATIAMYRTSVRLDGFRKGKVPASIIEKRFSKEVYKEATTDLVNVHINQIVSENKLTPVSRIDFEGGELERGKDFVYSISFEVMPEFEPPAYEGFAVEQEEAEVDEDEVDAVMERLRSNMGEVITVGTERTPRDGDIAVIDFEAFDEKGAPIAGIKANDFSLNLGEGQTLGDFENLIKEMRVGEEKEGPVSFPADFFNEEFAGRTVTMKARLHALKERKLPELDDAFARKAGGFDSVEKLRENVRRSYTQSRESLAKSAAQKKLLDGLLKMTDFPVPDSMLQSHVNMILGEALDKLERQGKSLASLGKTEDSLRKEIEPEALIRARSQIFLLTVAHKNGLTVSEQEVDLQLRRMALQSGEDYNAIKDYYTRNNLLFALRDRLLADKAMEEIYSKASVSKVPAGAPAALEAVKAEKSGTSGKNPSGSAKAASATEPADKPEAGTDAE